MLDFTYESYYAFLKYMKEVNTIYSFDSLADETQTGFILRHDIDFDLLCAKKMFEIEKSLGIRSTFFVLTSGDFYNIHSKANRKILNEISSFSEIGLHFDPTVYEGDGYCMTSEMNREKNLIEAIIKKEVKSISLHNPSLHNQYPIFEGLRNAYAKKYFNTDFYISDSSMNFRNKNPFDMVTKGKHNLVQVLIHPIHYSETSKIYPDIFSDKFQRDMLAFDVFMKQNKTYSEQLGEKNMLQYFLDRVK